MAPQSLKRQGKDFKKSINIFFTQEIRPMKKYLIILFSIGIGTLACRNVQSQEIQLGARGGLSSYTLKIDDGGNSLTQDSKIGFALGAFALYPINERISLQQELIFVQKKGEEYWGATSSLSYIELPILARVNLPLEAPFSPYALAGPSVGFLIKATVEDVDDEEVSEWFSSANIGISLGVGALFEAVNIDIRYDFGMLDINALDEDEIEYKTGGILLTVGYLFKK
ncbi:MAG: porin family protein [Balneolaceae bacterium]|nr:porin family protein [Balneolaceae bacterium]